MKKILKIVGVLLLALVGMLVLAISVVAFMFLLSPQQCSLVVLVTLFALIKEENRLTRKKIDENIRVSQEVHNKLSNIGM